MNKSKIEMLVGLPSSGKSTYAKEKVKDSHWKMVSKDNLRILLDNGIHSKDREEFICKARDAIICAAIGSGFNIIVDDTNFVNKHQNRLRELAVQLGCDFEVNDSFLSVDVNECIRRDALRGEKMVGKEVIEKMYFQYIKDKELEPIVFDKSLPECVICDIDGTLAHCKDRNIFDWSKVDQDFIDEQVRDFVNYQYEKGIKILIVSGRDEICRGLTEKWLKDNDVHYHEFFMRPLNNREKDTIIKRRILINDIVKKYFPILVIDDRNCVCQMWRSVGLKVFQVAEGNF
jgi:predicted kinase